MERGFTFIVRSTKYKERQTRIGKLYVNTGRAIKDFVIRFVKELSYTFVIFFAMIQIAIWILSCLYPGSSNNADASNSNYIVQEIRAAEIPQPREENLSPDNMDLLKERIRNSRSDIHSLETNTLYFSNGGKEECMVTMIFKNHDNLEIYELSSWGKGATKDQAFLQALLRLEKKL